MASDNNWKDNIIFQLKHRNQVEAHKFQDIIHLNNKIFKYAYALRTENEQLTSQLERTKVGAVEGKGGEGRECSTNHRS
ncbi:hypothetical protein WA026_003650 [Henosepilachna vigintioctopunctata]|uniref:Uncharacterized protein n=1 Tax=Henosepilachna vigintioctopunctata TaxID=420089 RepID=A0AAW1UDU2_9CUCU